VTALSEFFFNSRPSIIYLEGLEIIHANFSQTYRLIRNSAKTLSLTHEGAVGPFDYVFAPIAIKPLGSNTDLDQEIEVTLGDVGQIIAAELKRVSDANQMMVKPIVKYRVWRSDDLTDPLLFATLQIDAVSLTQETAAFKARSAAYNLVRTGEVYRIDRFPMLESV
jgi:hypothetical protein